MNQPLPHTDCQALGMPLKYFLERVYSSEVLGSCTVSPMRVVFVDGGVMTSHGGMLFVA